MNQTAWEKNRQIELKYKQSLANVTRLIDMAIKGARTPADITRELQKVYTSNSMKSLSQSIASKMITLTNIINAKSWRGASLAGSKGKQIYAGLHKELTTTNVGIVANEKILENANLIRTLPLTVSQQVTKYVASKAFEGLRSSEIAKALQSTTSAHAKANANLIARTETSKAMMALNEARALDVGIEWYIWRTANDGLRVRPGHRNMKGVLVQFKNPPAPEELIGQKTEGNYNAGEIYNCRCYAQPLMFLDDVSWPAKVHVNGSIVRISRSDFEAENPRYAKKKPTAKATPQAPAAAPKTKPTPTPPQIIPAPLIAPPQPKPAPVIPTTTFVPAKTIIQAEEYARLNLNIPTVDLSDIDIDAANDINKHFTKLKMLYGEVFYMEKLASQQYDYQSTFNEIVNWHLNQGYSQVRAEEKTKQILKKDKPKKNCPAYSISQAGSGRKGIYFNVESFGTKRRYENAKVVFESQLKSGQWTVGTVEGIISHELGHQIMSYLESKNMAQFIHDIYAEFKKEMRAYTPITREYQIIQELGKYGSETVREFFAEAFSEFTESAISRKYAKLIGDEVTKAFEIIRKKVIP